MVSTRELIPIREEFAKCYRKPAERFVSLGFYVKDGRPCLRVQLNRKYSRSGLPKTFHGLQVDVRYSPPAVLSVGAVS
jgi:hypothetical protein